MRKDGIKRSWNDAQWFAEMLELHPTGLSYKPRNGKEFVLVVGHEVDFNKFVLRLGDSNKIRFRSRDVVFRLDSASALNAFLQGECEYEVWDTHRISCKKPKSKDGAEQEAEKKVVAHRLVGYLRFTPTPEARLAVARFERRAEGMRKLAALKAALKVEMPKLDSISIAWMNNVVELTLHADTVVPIRVSVAGDGEAMFALEINGTGYNLLEIWNLLNV